MKWLWGLFLSGGLIAVVVLAAAVVKQGRRIDQLEATITELGSEMAGPPEADARGDELGSESPATPAMRAANDPRRLPAPPSSPEPDQPRVEEAVIEALESYDPRVRDRIRAVVQEEQDRIRTDRMQALRQRWKEYREDRLTLLADDAHLSSPQIDFLRDRLDAEHVAVTEVFQQARRNHSFGDARAKAESLRTETDTEVRDMLDDEQYAAYRQMRQEEQRQRFWAGPGASRGGGRTPSP